MGVPEPHQCLGHVSAWKHAPPCLGHVSAWKHAPPCLSHVSAWKHAPPCLSYVSAWKHAPPSSVGCWALGCTTFSVRPHIRLPPLLCTMLLPSMQWSRSVMNRHAPIAARHTPIVARWWPWPCSYQSHSRGSHADTHGATVMMSDNCVVGHRSKETGAKGSTRDITAKLVIGGACPC